MQDFELSANYEASPVARRFKKVFDEQVGTRTKTVVCYQDYLSNSAEVLGMLKKCISAGGRYLLTAECSAGKTNMALSALQKEFFGKRHMVVAVPNCIQTIQGRNFYYEMDGIRNYSADISAKSRKAFKIDCIHSTIATYDACAKMLNLSDEKLAKTVLFVDEAHQLFSAREYRNGALARLSQVVNKVVDAGGCAILMTATPRKLDGFPIRQVIECIRTDFAGKKCVTNNFSQMELYRVASEKNSLREGVVRTVLELHRDGYIPFIRINDKKAIKKISANLSARGLNVRELTADDKSYVVLRDQFGNAQEVVYDNEIFKGITTMGQMPYADVYLVTSILEVGTSITSVCGQNPENLVPVFVSDAKNFDVDDMRQFFARIRFRVKKAAVLIREYRPGKDTEIDNSIKPDFYQQLLKAFKNAENHQAGYAIASKARSLVTDMGGMAEDRDIIVQNSGDCRYILIDMMQVFGNAWSDYDRQFYFRKDFTADYLAEVFQSRVVLKEIPYFKPEPVSVNISVDESIGELLQIAAKEPTFFTALSSPEKASDEANLSISRIRKLNGGCQVIENLATLYAGNAFPDNMVETAIAMTKSNSKKIDMSAEKDGSLMVDPLEVTCQSICNNILAGWPAKKQLQFIAYWNSLKSNNITAFEKAVRFIISRVPRTLGEFITDPQEYRAVNMFMGTGYMEAIMDFFSTDILQKNYSRTWKKVCLLAGRSTLEEIQDAARQQHIVHFNKCLKAGNINEIAPTRLRSGAEYMALAQPRKGFTYPDESGKKRVHFEKGFIGKVVSPYDAKQIALLMPGLMKKNFPTDLRSGHYSAKTVINMLKNIYVHEDLGNGKIRIRQYRMKLAEKYNVPSKTADDISEYADQMLSHEDGEITPSMKQMAINQIDTDIKRLQNTIPVTKSHREAIISEIRLELACGRHLMERGIVKRMLASAVNGCSPQLLAACSHISGCDGQDAGMPA